RKQQNKSKRNMIERKFIKQNVSEQRIQEFVLSQLGRAGISHVKLQITPLGEKIVVFSSHPGLVVGSGGENIKAMTAMLKKNFKLENPQIEISEVSNPNLDAQIVADKISSSLERYGSKNFKGVMHRTISDVLNAGVKGVEIILSGKIPGSRAKSWRILSGYMKKCGDIAVADVKFARSYAKLKSGVIGVKVKIMPSDIVLPDTVKITEEEEKEIISEEIPKESEKKEEKPKEEKKEKPKRAAKKPKKKEEPKEPKENDKEVKDV
ncbi:30S ribosomal protein S3, partial [Candidatus Woesearchaeota archaeon]|nr:30S ribosomal protein S3 [Candidatus Woesearchaeota archaeon]